MVGVARAGIPPVLNLRLDLLGVIDLERRVVSFDLSLVDSGMLGIFAITGDAAFRLSYGSTAYTVLSIGGFYPGFDPRPAQIPPMSRAGMHLTFPLPGVTLRAEAYFAVASNTLHFGGAVEAGFDAAAVSASGFLSLDALIQFSPFHFRADVSAGFHVKALGLTFCGVRLDGTIDGPGPIVIHGRMTIETFLKDISWDESFTFGDRVATSKPHLFPLDELAPELDKPANLRAGAGTDPEVRLAPRPATRPRAAVSPLAELVWSQRRAPLDLRIDRLEGVPLGGVQGVQVNSSAPQRGIEPGRFAPGSFITLTRSEALNKPAFDDLDAGLRMSWPALESSAWHWPKPPDRMVIRKVLDEDESTIIPNGAAWRLVSAGVLDMIASRGRESTVTSRAPMIGVNPENSLFTAAGAKHTSATSAHQEVRTAGARLALPEVDLLQPVDVSGV